MYDWITSFPMQSSIMHSRYSLERAKFWIWKTMSRFATPRPANAARMSKNQSSRSKKKSSSDRFF